MKRLIDYTDEELVALAQKILAKYNKALSEAKEIAMEYGFEINGNQNNVLNIIYAKLKEQRDAVTQESVEPVFRSSLESLSKKGEFAKMTELLSLYNEGKYKEVKTILEGLGLFHVANERRRHNSDAAKAPATKLKVTFPDGKVICYDKASDTLVAVVDFIGLDKVQQLGWSVSGAPFVSDELVLSDDRSRRAQKAFKGKYITTHSSTATKFQQIKKLFKNGKKELYG